MKIVLKVIIALFVVGIILIGIWFSLDKYTKCKLIYGKNICNFYEMMDTVSIDPEKSDFDKAMQLCEEMKDVPKKDSCFEYVAEVVSFYNKEKAREACGEIKGFDGVHSKEDCLNRIVNWKIYHNSVYNIELKYPADWQPKEDFAYTHRYEGEDGFFQLSAISGEGLLIDEVYRFEAYHKLQPYGSQPKIERLEIEGQEARLILPSDDQSQEMQSQVGLIIQYPHPIQISGTTYYYSVLWTDQNHIRKIAETLRFIE